MVEKIVKECPLFEGIEEDNLESLLECLQAKRFTFAKDEFVFKAGGKTGLVGIVLYGGVYVIQEDFWGNRTILSHMGKAEMFGEAFSCSRKEILPVSVIAAEKTKIMLIDYRKTVINAGASCMCHARLTMNMLSILAGKNIMLTRKMEHISKRTIREKLLSFLSAQAMRTKSEILEIPFNRQELADYLYVDRSALSRELGLMQKEGLIKFDKNRFELLHRAN